MDRSRPAACVGSALRHGVSVGIPARWGDDLHAAQSAPDVMFQVIVPFGIGPSTVEVNTLDVGSQV